MDADIGHASLCPCYVTDADPFDAYPQLKSLLYDQQGKNLRRYLEQGSNYRIRIGSIIFDDSDKCLSFLRPDHLRRKIDQFNFLKKLDRHSREERENQDLNEENDHLHLWMKRRTDKIAVPIQAHLEVSYWQYLDHLASTSQAIDSCRSSPGTAFPELEEVLLAFKKLSLSSASGSHSGEGSTSGKEPQFYDDGDIERSQKRPLCPCRYGK